MPTLDPMLGKRCEKTDLLETDCAHCRNSYKEVERTRTADFRSACTSCGGTINPKDQIGRVEGVWVCSSCTREAKVKSS
jgi:PHP family Zn ribbon phosphoesterase